jgi:hypothetical protein
MFTGALLSPLRLRQRLLRSEGRDETKGSGQQRREARRRERPHVMRSVMRGPAQRANLHVPHPAIKSARSPVLQLGRGAKYWPSPKIRRFFLCAHRYGYVVEVIVRECVRVGCSRQDGR